MGGGQPSDPDGYAQSLSPSIIFCKTERIRILTWVLLPGKGKYPHVYNNYENIAFNDCVGLTLYEYPVLRGGGNPWVPAGKKTQLPEGQPDRVIFSPSGTDSATYCGMITHPGAGGNFIPCEV